MIGKQNAEESSMTDNITQELANLFWPLCAWQMVFILKNGFAVQPPPSPQGYMTGQQKSLLGIQLKSGFFPLNDTQTACSTALFRE